MPFQRSEMLYTYNWSTKYENDDPRVTGEPDSTLLDRTEGYEMLYFINSCARKWNWTGYLTSAYQRLEKIIKTEVPSDIRSQQKIKEWIESRYISI